MSEFIEQANKRIYSLRSNLIPFAKQIILTLISSGVFTEKNLGKIKQNSSKINRIPLVKNTELIVAYNQLLKDNLVEKNTEVEFLIQKKKVRSQSGIANVTVLTRFFGCPGKCIYCPTEPEMPKSYLSNEPAVMRGARNEFDGYRQTKERINSLKAQGHNITKIDIRTAGGTWNALPIWYQDLFVKSIYLALNEGPGEIQNHSEEYISSLNLNDLIKENETTHCRCVGFWIETRPDWISEKELIRLRNYGITGIEIGLQTTNDDVNVYNKRGHGIKEVFEATKLCRDIGLKICHHLMPNLPSATLENDIQSGRDLFMMEGLRPDYIKVYPTMVTPFSELEKLVTINPNFHKAYTDDELITLIAEIKKSVPRYCRIIRIIRDIPAESILIGSHKSNLRQEIAKKSVICECIKCREISTNEILNWEISVEEYNANQGKEFFISINEINLDKLIGLCRLRLVNSNSFIEELKNAAIIRELHVYGKVEGLKYSTNSNSQHLGFGRMLMNRAEEIAKQNGYDKIAVISAIGTREYYRKLGYKLEGTYMIKELM